MVQPIIYYGQSVHAVNIFFPVRFFVFCLRQVMRMWEASESESLCGIWIECIEVFQPYKYFMRIGTNYLNDT